MPPSRADPVVLPTVTGASPALPAALSAHGSGGHGASGHSVFLREPRLTPSAPLPT